MVEHQEDSKHPFCACDVFLGLQNTLAIKYLADQRLFNYEALQLNPFCVLDCSNKDGICNNMGIKCSVVPRKMHCIVSSNSITFHYSQPNVSLNLVLTQHEQRKKKSNSILRKYKGSTVCFIKCLPPPPPPIHILQTDGWFCQSSPLLGF